MALFKVRTSAKEIAEGEDPYDEWWDALILAIAELLRTAHLWEAAPAATQSPGGTQDGSEDEDLMPDYMAYEDNYD